MMNKLHRNRSIYLISALWTDSMENEISARSGYSPLFYVNSLQTAKKICEESGIYKGEWGCGSEFDKPNMIYEKIKEYDGVQLINKGEKYKTKQNIKGKPFDIMAVDNYIGETLIVTKVENGFSKNGWVYFKTANDIAGETKHLKRVWWFLGCCEKAG